MKALVYHGAGNKSWEEVADAVVESSTDAVVRVDTTTICGTDLHILSGDVPAVTKGRILGHEAVGTVVQVGESVSTFSVGDRVLVPAVTKCGRCVYCQKNMPSHCQTVGGVGWILGHLIDGTQAELVRVPYADTSLYAIPDNITNEQALFLADSLPTGYEVGVLAGKVRPGDTVAVVGAGAVGLASILTTGLWGAARTIAIDSNKFRLQKALEFGATDIVEVGPGTVSDVLALTDGLGVDVAIEAVGFPETLLTAMSLVRPGGTVANVGVHGTPVELPMQDLWIQNLTLTMGLVDTTSIPTLLTMVGTGRIRSELMSTHSFTFDEFDAAYDTFAHAADNSALKVTLSPAI
ncbi:alcohol dehydrogenase [Rhodococcus sp. 05-2256-B2]|jgi:alcohol dehydrogenase|uniref:alcohol dehydrogenase catalytic domain-containing protein n=1 Tax=Nocardiaceae TaxID=85025 RepID=UPI00050C5124|nr:MULTISPECIES: alcohol dehydrogenase catalytic domain-containing protein [Rhodococcus]MBY4382150.1 alcohol dehydrogenase catalytic domain-containing protein [Rhodococcus fascians]MBY4397019.1 alcohol dehydrogenase catalytic domain-containing protein [Rhodococcus fascians]MBY4405839.1 alcohol dehydrogenase catalytic domain-containing protein [Rhodococcus fascians]MBY4421777.1 alcohol dehydrogenase catalytic domain-containing protein [Rhodococcus fascians]MBY4460953.1 alcohol dehydrogenase cat